jgi:carbamate kinase
MADAPPHGFRRVVASPEPKVIVELPAIRAALESNALVIACGGGGIPVVYRDATLVGVEAVIDKDRTSALLAWELEAELFLISTAVENVSLHYATPEESRLGQMSPEEARRFLAEGQFPPGSMGPKIEAALSYLDRGGRHVIITSPEKLPEALHGMAGTHIAAASVLAQMRLERVA